MEPEVQFARAPVLEIALAACISPESIERGLRSQPSWARTSLVPSWSFGRLDRETVDQPQSIYREVALSPEYFHVSIVASATHFMWPSRTGCPERRCWARARAPRLVGVRHVAHRGRAPRCRSDASNESGSRPLPRAAGHATTCATSNPI